MGSHWAWCIFANFNGGLGDPCSVKRKVFSHSKVLFFQYLCISLPDIYGLAFVHIMMTLEAKRYLHVDCQSEGPRVHSSLFSAVGGLLYFSSPLYLVSSQVKDKVLCFSRQFSWYFLSFYFHSRDTGG